MNFNGDVSLATLQPAPVFPELYYPFWLCSGGAGGYLNSNGMQYVKKGTTSATTNYNDAGTTLFTLPSNWPSTLKCAFEVALGASAGGTTANAQLIDITNAGAVVASVSTTSASMTVVRSGQFTLTGNHSYGLKVYPTGTSNNIPMTDASLIVFPSSPLVSPSVSAISLANPSGNTLKEAYIPLWVYSSGISAMTASASLGVNFAQKGVTSSTTTASNAILFTLSNQWSASQKFAFESSLEASGASGYTSSLALYDVTASSVVSSSTVTTTSSTLTLLRSSSFNLTPGHSYAITGSGNPTSYPVHFSKAHLVALA